MQNMRQKIVFVLALTTCPLSWAADSPQMPAPMRGCQVKQPEEILNKTLCGNDAACAAAKKAELEQAAEAHKCEMARLMPPPLPVPSRP